MNSIKRHPITAYFVFAFLFSWLLAGMMIARSSLDLPGWLHYLVAWGPAVAAVLVTGVTSGLPGIRTLIGRLFRWQIGGRAWLLAVGSPLLLLACAVLISALTTGVMPDLNMLGVIDYFGDIGIPAALLVWIFSFGIGEEIGWRGFAQQHLEPQRGLLFTSILIGVIWACWHTPFFFYKDTYVAMGLISFPFFVVNIVPGAVVLGWLYSRTKSILAVGLWHGLFDFATASAVDGGTVAAIISMGVMLWALIIVVTEVRSKRINLTAALWRTFVKLQNPLMTTLLRSRLHPAVSRMYLLLTFTGRKSGKRYTTPVQYAQEGNRLYIITSAGYTWWKNLQGGAAVQVHLRGGDLVGHADTTADPASIRAILAKIYPVLRGDQQDRFVTGKVAITITL